jgi:hypothetical protein
LNEFKTPLSPKQFVFIDNGVFSMRDIKSAEEIKIYDEEMKKIKKFTCSSEPFLCQDIVEALKQKDKEFEEKLRIIQENFEKEKDIM